MDYVILTLAAVATALATGLGAIPVFVFGTLPDMVRGALWGLTVGLMTVASVVGLLAPALDDGPPVVVSAGLATGAFFLLGARMALRKKDVHVGQLRGSGVRTSVLVFSVLFVHSLPEGLAIGTAYASDRAGLSLFVIFAIALQNIPEGTSVAIPMAAAGFRPRSQFWAAVGTSAPQPLGAVVAYVLVGHVEPLLPFSFAFAAGAMLTLVVFELAREAFAPKTWPAGIGGSLLGGALMLGLAALLGV
jgi:zinc transporter, ZIP family